MINSVRVTGILVFCCGLICLAVSLAAIRAIHDGRKSQLWVPVPATVDIAEERVDFGGRGIGRYWHVEYRYNFNGAFFRSARAAFMGFVPAELREQISHWKAGQEITAYVNPEAPAQAVLYRQTPTGVYVVGAIAPIMAALLMWFSLKLRNNPHVQQSVRELFSHSK